MWNSRDLMWIHLSNRGSMITNGRDKMILATKFINAHPQSCPIILSKLSYTKTWKIKLSNQLPSLKTTMKNIMRKLPKWTKI